MTKSKLLWSGDGFRAINIDCITAFELVQTSYNARFVMWAYDGNNLHWITFGTFNTIMDAYRWLVSVNQRIRKGGVM
jgi:hypothetical protein